MIRIDLAMIYFASVVQVTDRVVIFVVASGTETRILLPPVISAIGSHWAMRSGNN